MRKVLFISFLLIQSALLAQPGQFDYVQTDQVFSGISGSNANLVLYGAGAGSILLPDYAGVGDRILQIDATGLVSATTTVLGDFLTVGDIGTTVEAWDSDLDALAALATTGLVKRTGAGAISTITDNSSNWNAAYNDKINSGGFNTGTGDLTLTQQDAGTVVMNLDGRYIEEATFDSTWVTITADTVKINGYFLLRDSTFRQLVEARESQDLQAVLDEGSTATVSGTFQVVGSGSNTAVLQLDPEFQLLLNWIAGSRTNTIQSNNNGINLQVTNSGDLAGVIVDSDEIEVNGNAPLNVNTFADMRDTIQLSVARYTGGSYDSWTDDTLAVPSWGVVKDLVDTSTVLRDSDIGSTVQAWDTDLDGISGISTTGLLSRTSAGTYETRAITGTTDRIDVTNGDGVSGNPTIDIAATYAGQASINTIGTITSGTWQGSVIDEAYLDADVVTFPDTVATIATQYDLTQVQGYTVTNEADNRVVTSTGAGTGNAETNLQFDGTDLNLVTGGLQIGGTEVISSGRAITGTTVTASGDLTQSGNTYTHTTRQGILVNGNNTIGLNQLGGGIIFSEVNGTKGGNSGAAIYAKQTASDNNEVGIAFSTHGATAGDPRVERLTITGNGSITTNGGSLTAGAITGTTVAVQQGTSNSLIDLTSDTKSWRLLNDYSTDAFRLQYNLSSRFVVSNTGEVTIPSLAGTGDRLVKASSTGGVSTIATGTEGQVLTVVGGNWAAADAPDNKVGLYEDLTISSGEITIPPQTKPITWFRVDTEGGAASDDLETINVPPGDIGHIIIIRSNNNARDIVVKRDVGVGNITMDADFTLDNISDQIMLIFVGGNWACISKQDN